MQQSHREAPKVELPRPKQILEHKFGEPKTNIGEFDGTLRVISFNIFLGQNLDAVLYELSLIEPFPDVLLLQEDNIFEDSMESVNNNNERKIFRHVGGAIAKKFNCNCCFIPTYFRGDGEKIPLRGCYGMSILSRFKLENINLFPCGDTRPTLVKQLSDYVYGERAFAYAEALLPGEKKVGFISVHLPSVGKFYERKAMIQQLFENVDSLKTKSQQDIPVIIGGDCNTFPFVARYLPFLSTDLLFSCKSESEEFKHFVEREDNGFSFSLFDPFPTNTKTIWRENVKGSKLDWIFLEKNKFEVTSKQVQKEGTKPTSKLPSDHKWLLVDCILSHKNQ
mmetsp:Transcript_14665/g.18138  ORF Transcript_14665/g.18138 Transcript_14665/m.18138 type:complete len:336 (-) Transcript_14665:686-1693(-)